MSARTVKVEIRQRRGEFDMGAMKPCCHVVDTATDRPIVEGSPRQVHSWLTNNGYRWLPGSQFIWSRSTAIAGHVGKAWGFKV